MYIVYSNNLLNGEVVARGPQYFRREEAVSNLIKEVQNYLFIYKRIENHKIVQKMTETHIDPDIIWYIERPDDRENEIVLYKVITEKIDSWWSSANNTVIEKHMIFSVMDIPEKQKYMESAVKKEFVPDQPKSTNTVSHVEMMSALQKALQRRREVIERESQKSQKSQKNAL